MCVKRKRRRLDESVAFFLIKSDVRRNSAEVAKVIAEMPEVEEVCFTEGKYSFLARISADPDDFGRLQAKLGRRAGILAVERLHAPTIMRFTRPW